MLNNNDISAAYRKGDFSNPTTAVIIIICTIALLLVIFILYANIKQ